MHMKLLRRRRYLYLVTVCGGPRKTKKEKFVVTELIPWNEPPVKFGCNKCRFLEKGCGTCRSAAGWTVETNAHGKLFKKIPADLD